MVNLWDRAGLCRMPIGVDQQPRIAGQNRCCVHFFRQPAGDGGGADVIGNVHIQRVLSKPKPVHGLRHGVAGVIADNQQWRLAQPVNPQIRFGIAGTD
jgi:hypothetical protein